MARTSKIIVDGVEAVKLYLDGTLIWSKEEENTELPVTWDALSFEFYDNQTTELEYNEEYQIQIKVNPDSGYSVPENLLDGLTVMVDENYLEIVEDAAGDQKISYDSSDSIISIWVRNTNASGSDTTASIDVELVNPDDVDAGYISDTTYITVYTEETEVSVVGIEYESNSLASTYELDETNHTLRGYIYYTEVYSDGSTMPGNSYYVSEPWDDTMIDDYITVTIDGFIVETGITYGSTIS